MHLSGAPDAEQAYGTENAVHVDVLAVRICAPPAMAFPPWYKMKLNPSLSPLRSEHLYYPVTPA